LATQIKNRRDDGIVSLEDTQREARKLFEWLSDKDPERQYLIKDDFEPFFPVIFWFFFLFFIFISVKCHFYINEYYYKKYHKG